MRSKRHGVRGIMPAMNRAVMFATALSLFCFISSASAQAPRAATPGDQLKLPPGFKAELLHSATENEGSWVSLAIDDKGHKQKCTSTRIATLPKRS